jgi:hypothetical protein
VEAGGGRGGGILAHLARAAVYLLLVLWLAWPLSTHLGSHLPRTAFSADFDALYTAWALAWETHALTTDPARLLDANIYHPTPAALLYGPTAFGALPFFAPVFLVTGNAVLATNVTLLVALGLTALGAHLVVARWTDSEPAGFVAGAAFLANRWMWQWAPTAPQFAVLVYLPWIMYLAAPIGRRAMWILLALVVLQALAEPVYLAPAVLVPLGVLGAVRLASPRARASGVRLLAVTVAAAAVLAPLYLGYARIRAANAALPEQTLWRNEALMPLLLPTRLSWDGLAGMGPARISTGLMLLVLAGAFCLALAPRSDDARRGWRQAGFWTAASLLLSTRVVAPFDLGSFELPHFRLLGRIAPSLVATMRSPSRLGLGAAVGVAILAGLAVAACARAAGRLVPRSPIEAGLAAAVAIGLLADLRGAVGEMAITPALRLDTPVLAAVAREKGPLVELPVDPIRADAPGAKLAIENARAMFRSIGHWRPLLNGYSSYWPTGFPERMAAAARLPDSRALETLRTTADLAAVLVDLDELDPEARSRWLALATRDPTHFRLVARDEHSLLFDVTPSRTQKSASPSARK